MGSKGWGGGGKGEIREGIGLGTLKASKKFSSGGGGWVAKSNIVSVPVPLWDLERPREARQVKEG